MKLICQPSLYNYHAKLKQEFTQRQIPVSALLGNICNIYIIPINFFPL